MISSSPDLFTSLIIFYRWPTRCFALCKQWKEALNSSKRIHLDSLSLSNTGDVLLNLNLAKAMWPNEKNLYSVLIHFTCFILDLQKHQKEWTVVNLTSGGRHKPPQGNDPDGKKRKGNKTQLLKGCNNMQAAYERDFRISRHCTDFSTSQRTGLLNGFFAFTGIKGTRERKCYCAVDAVVPFLTEFLDRSPGCSDKPVLTPINTLYLDIVNLLLFGSRELNWHHQCVLTLQQMIVALKCKEFSLYGDVEDVNLFTQKFHLLDHFAEDVVRYRVEMLAFSMHRLSNIWILLSESLYEWRPCERDAHFKRL